MKTLPRHRKVVYRLLCIIYHYRVISLFANVLLMTFPQFIKGQSLRPCSLAVIRINEDNPDAFSFVVLADIPSGDTIYFTDEGWNGSGWIGNSEDHLIYISPGLVAGDVVHVEETGDGLGFNVTGAGGIIEYAPGYSGFSLSSGDQLLVYQSPDGAEPDNPVFITGIHLDDGLSLGGNDTLTGWTNQAYLDNGGTSVNASAVPTGLVNGKDCIALFPGYDGIKEKDNARYDCTKGISGTGRQLMSLICNRDNWLSDNTTPFNESSVCRFSVFRSPGIEVTGNGKIITDGSRSPEISDNTDFATAEIPDRPATRTFLINNTGDSMLTISSITLDDTTHFSIISEIPDSIPPGESRVLELLFNPVSTGNHSAIVSICNNDNENAAFSFGICGTALFKVNFNISDIKCAGGNDGRITALAAGGTADYTFIWSTGDSIRSGSASCTIEGLFPGTYTVRISDGNNIEVTDTVMIEEPPELSVSVLDQTNVECPVGRDGQIRAEVAGGTPPYSLLWSDGDTSLMRSNLPAGIYLAIVTDLNGCGVSLTDTIKVIDPEPPVAICSDTILQLDKNGFARLNPQDLCVASTDNCGVVSWLNNDTVFTCNDLGSREVISVVGDSYGNLSECTSLVTVLDTSPPEIVCNDTIIYLDEEGSSTLNSLSLFKNLSDNCTIDSINPVILCFNGIDLTLPEDSANLCINEFHYDNVGHDEAEFIEIAGKSGINLDGYKIVLYNGGNGLSYQTIDLSGTIPEESEGFGAVSFDATGMQNGPDGIALVSPDSLVIEFVSYEGALQAFDGPAYGFTSRDIGIEENGESTGGSLSRFNNLFWLVSGTSSPGFLNPGQTLPPREKGQTGITVSDFSGNIATCSSMVTILDTIIPHAICRDTTLFLNPDGTTILKPQIIDAGSYDNSGIIRLNISKSIFNCDDIGDNQDTLFVKDASGNQAVCEAAITVIDTTRPVFQDTENVVYHAIPGACESAVDYPEITVINKCGCQILQTEGLGPDGLFPIGTTTEKYLATGLSGYSDTLSFGITVVSPDKAPSILPVPDITAEEDSILMIELEGISDGGDCYPQLTEISALAANPAAIADLQVDYISGDSTAWLRISFAANWHGITGITVRVGDSGGESVTDTFTITVNPVNDPPVVVNPLTDCVVHAGHKLEVPVSSQRGEIFDDPDDDPLTIKLYCGSGEALPPFMHFYHDTLHIIPQLRDTGYVSVVIAARDPLGELATDTFIVNVKGYKTSVADLQEKMWVQIYPNPSHGTLIVELEPGYSPTASVSVFSSDGRKILRKLLNETRAILNLSSLTDGVYYLRIISGKREITKKLVIIRE